jgi:phage baseplate assembly protein V
MFERGVVTDIDPGGRVKVRLADRDRMETHWIEVPTLLAGKARLYGMPRAGESVKLLLDPRGEEGMLLGAYFSKNRRPPTDNPNDLVLELENGIRIEARPDEPLVRLSVGTSEIILERDEITIRAKKLNLRRV